MVVWALVVIVVLLIPILAIVLDSQIGSALADRLSGGRSPGELSERIDALESEVRYLDATVQELREESRFLRSLVEGEEDGDGERARLEAPRAEERRPPDGD
jgi:outer membrane murein-binding lipoprotein Lpp